MDQVSILLEYAKMLTGAAIAGLGIGLAYRYAVTPTNRVAWLPPVMVLLAITTALVIAIIKTSLALSLGLIGALSVARFRSSVQDPRQLALILVAVAIGIGFGANEYVLTAIGTIFIMGGIFVFYNSDFWEPPEPARAVATNKVVARFKLLGDQAITADPVSDFLANNHISHQIIATERKAKATLITAHLYDCSVLEADDIIRHLADFLANHRTDHQENIQVETDLLVKPLTRLEQSELQQSSNDLAGSSIPRYTTEPSASIRRS